MLNILTIDLEDYFQVHAFSDVIKFEDWGNYECRIERNTNRLLEILNVVTQNSTVKTQNSKLDHSITYSLNNSLSRKVQATFFVLGWLAERYPDLIRRIHKEGHEIACHGYAHKLIYTQSKEEFRQDIRKCKAILEDITGSEVIGYRAPSYSITNKSRWAFEVLVEEGFQYDSSVFPIRHDFYGMPDAPRFPFMISLNGNHNVEFLVLNYELNTTQNAKLITQNSALKPQSSVLKANSTLNTDNSKLMIEFPLSTIRVLGTNIPISGGGYFRLFPYPFIKKGLKRINKVEKKPFIFYVHPWEIDPNQPRIKNLRMRSRLRHYINLDKTESKFKRLLGDFQFSTIRQILIHNS
jgi:polysaccharide deacetylase family protein (PEP-CTERM system associated)